MVISTIGLSRASSAWSLLNRPLSCPLDSTPPHSKVRKAQGTNTHRAGHAVSNIPTILFLLNSDNFSFCSRWLQNGISS
ncbi:hypothetical protein TNCV_452391 [Trichonephila clavipes]|nr:hypothetical protein TNCV_452391 [Trichonephila clavipes]